MKYSILDVVILMGGIYLLWSAIKMRSKGKVAGILLSKGMDLSKAKDTPGFIRAMYIPTIIMGILCTVSGVVGFAVVYWPQLMMPQLLLTILAFVGLITYGYLNVRAQKKYLGL